MRSPNFVQETKNLVIQDHQIVSSIQQWFDSQSKIPPAGDPHDDDDQGSDKGNGPGDTNKGEALAQGLKGMAKTIGGHNNEQGQGNPKLPRYPQQIQNLAKQTKQLP